MKILENQSLKSYNTFGLEVAASLFARVKSESELIPFLKNNRKKLFILGGGSNILLAKDLDNLVLKNEINGIEIIRDFKHCVHVAIGGGENWHKVVLWAIKNNLGGIENLSLIPGTVGAAPIQNIGAYGVELKDVFINLDAIFLKDGSKKVFHKKHCDFGYRDSIFKRSLKGKVLISKVVLKLTKKHRINSSYGAIQAILENNKIKNPGIQDISKAVIQIRSSKLPDPAIIGNAGSFFKNPEISKSAFLKLQKKFPDIVFYQLPNGKVKIPAGWLIEKDGWKGKQVGNTGNHAKQALVIVNYGKASGLEIEAHANRVMLSVKKKFGIQLQAEVNIIK